MLIPLILLVNWLSSQVVVVGSSVVVVEHECIRESTSMVWNQVAGVPQNQFNTYSLQECVARCMLQHPEFDENVLIRYPTTVS